jgi:predicted metal-dependent hydrolase
LTSAHQLKAVNAALDKLPDDDRKVVKAYIRGLIKDKAAAQTAHAMLSDSICREAAKADGITMKAKRELEKELTKK